LFKSFLRRSFLLPALTVGLSLVITRFRFFGHSLFPFSRFWCRGRPRQLVTISYACELSPCATVIPLLIFCSQWCVGSVSLVLLMGFASAFGSVFWLDPSLYHSSSAPFADQCLCLTDVFPAPRKREPMANNKMLFHRPGSP